MSAMLPSKNVILASLLFGSLIGLAACKKVEGNADNNMTEPDNVADTMEARDAEEEAEAVPPPPDVDGENTRTEAAGGQ